MSFDLQRVQQGRSCIEKGRRIQEDIFGPDHPLILQYFSFIGQQLAREGQVDQLKQLSQTVLTKMAGFNQSAEGMQSIFLLETHFEQALLQNDFEPGEDPDEIRSIIASMESTC